VGHSEGCAKGKFITMSDYITKIEKSQINNLMMHPKLLEKWEPTKSKTCRLREIIKIKVKISEIETKETIQQTNETQNRFLKKINVVDKP
jgi:predicted FMN-binding regulatory protein PaiB